MFNQERGRELETSSLYKRRRRARALKLNKRARQRAATPSEELNHSWFDIFRSTMETEKRTQKSAEQTVTRDLSEQIKEVTKESHVRAENTELMLSFQRGQVTLPQYKLLLCSLYEIYRALEEEMDRNSNHPAVAPIYFPAELARIKSIEKDLEYFYGPDWREKIVVPVATQRYSHRLRQIGKENPEFLVAHAYTRYLGDLSGGQVLGRIAQKSMGLKSGEGLSFFAFPGVSSPNLFKQLYRSRMNSVELTAEERNGVLEEAVRAFEFNIQVFDGLQKMLSVAGNQQRQSSTDSKAVHGKTLQILGTFSPMLRMVLGLFVALAAVVGLYAL
ncbi:heme oxygenase isoform X2 [Poecilia latipinna]|uniref:heme oxygenase isoform X2 n=1 Tax=Poecilia latipinna TaxID=48699 RepID=UPI00072E3982|nr:PREDICTED: heme oxygenase-like isoform X2 [Poecilia latipinna]